jgi:hypothetical protein
MRSLCFKHIHIDHVGITAAAARVNDLDIDTEQR